MHIYFCFTGLKKILKVCGQVPELSGQLPMTENTQLIASVLLNKLYDDLSCDPERNNYRDLCEEYVKYVHMFYWPMLWPRLTDQDNIL